MAGPFRMPSVKPQVVAANAYGAGKTPEQKAADDEAERKRAAAAAVHPGLPGFTEFLTTSRDADMKKGAAWADGKFGASNPEIKEILDQRRERALGLNTAEVTAMRDRGMSGINQQLATNLRGLKGLQGATGLSGGATLGQALPSLSHATQARAGLETDIALADMQRRGQELGAYESTLTGERAGALGAEFGFAGLGVSDRSSALEHLLGQDFIKGLNGNKSGGRTAVDVNGNPYDPANPRDLLGRPYDPKEKDEQGGPGSKDPFDRDNFGAGMPSFSTGSKPWWER